MMDTTTAKTSIKNIQSEASSLSPSTLITLFEIDISTIARDTGVITSGDLANSDSIWIFRFHNNAFLLNKSIYWQGKEYIAAPIQAEGFEINSAETTPTPRLKITTNSQGVESLALLKRKIFEMGELVGAKVTRIRTFLKYLDRQNFPSSSIAPIGFSPDSNAEFPRDVFYVDRKSNEDKFSIEYTLATLMDVEGVMLPLRMVTSNTCTFMYRGDGCCYEYSSRRSGAVHGATNPLPELAPPIANERDEIITSALSIDSTTDRGEWMPNTTYWKGDSIYVEKNGVKYYFVCRENNPIYPPPNQKSWEKDVCSKTMRGCDLRWGANGSVFLGRNAAGLAKGYLRMGAFPGVNKVR